jgi:hypothetical protein
MSNSGKGVVDKSGVVTHGANPPAPSNVRPATAPKAPPPAPKGK